MKFNATVAVVCLLMATACASPGKRHSDNQIEAPQPAPSPSAPYAGVWLADVDEAGAVSNGAMVLGVVAGPAAIAGVKPNDRIVRINGIAVDADSATAIIKSSSPGDQLVLEVVRGKDVLTITMVIDSVEPWIAPAVLPSAIPFTSSERPEQMGVQDRVMAEVVAAVPDAERLLLGINKMFLSLAREDIGYNKLPLIRAAMLNAAVISQWQHQLADDLRPFELQRDALIEVMCDTLAAACGNREQAAPGQSVTLQTFAEAIAEANQQVRALFEDAGIDRAQAFADLQYLLRTTAAERTLIDQPDVARGLRAMRTSTKINHAVLLDVMAHVLSNASGSVEFSGASRPAPPELSDIVEGEIADYIKIDSGYIVAGGAGSNRYNMSRIYAVIDAGGNDFYQWNDEISLETQTIIDFGGDDRYRASTGGPGAGWLGVSLLIDFAGDDAYESKLGGCGTGALGFGFLFDGDGSDRYHCAAWSIGSSIYGGGAVVDQGMQTDEYISEVFSQGVGGPRGVGILIDAGGDDLYRANGPIPSAYQTPGSFMTFSQGVGTGIRPYDFGGVGILLDYGGDDRYEGGEFAQGGGYLWGVGVLRDESGSDMYYATRYAQGFAAHQAFGMLTDLSGDDIYWSNSAATQGAAWDQSIAILFDAEGNDIYRAHSLSQGAAAQQSRALLHDVAGNDRYWSSARDTQGAAGSNTYHFRAGDPVYSLGVLFDERGDDIYSTGVGNNETVLRLDTNSHAGRGVAGVIIDLQ